MIYTDQQLKATLAKMLPDQVSINHEGDLVWFQKSYKALVFDTELLHLCWMVAKELTQDEFYNYGEEAAMIIRRPENIMAGDDPETKFHFNGFGMAELCGMTWQQRVVALCKVKGVEI